MPRIQVSRGLDVYSLLDADSHEAKAFTTYLGYWDGLDRLIENRYGSAPARAIVAELERTRAVRRLQSGRFTGNPNHLAQILLAGWTQELALYAVDDDDPRLMLHNLWNNVAAYYATSGSARGWLLVRDGHVPEGHRGLLRALAAQVDGSFLYPCPWNLSCISEQPLVFGGFPSEPPDVHNLETGGAPLGVVAKALKTTRRKHLDRLVDHRKREMKQQRAPRGLRAELDEDLEATTVFDFLWRNRTRSNYGDPSMFYVGSLTEDRSRHYVRAVRNVTASTMLVFETLIAQRAPQVLLDAAVHFMARDRARTSEDVLGTRLRALGLLTIEPDDDIGWTAWEDEEPF